MKQNIELQLGIFKGFYNSFLEDHIDENINEDLNEIGKDYDDCTIDYNMIELAKDLFEFSKYEYYNELNFLSNLEFSELSSPKYYNYSNDKIYFNCEIDKIEFLNWFNGILTANDDISEMIKESIIETHTSCSGFNSFHSNRIRDWITEINTFDLENKDTIYKIGFVISEYIEQSKIFEDFNWSLESDYLENSDRNGLYACYSIKEYNELMN